MNSKLSQLMTISLLMALVASVVPAPVYATTITPVTPTQFENDVLTTMTTGGSKFSVDSVVTLLNGYFDVVAQATDTPLPTDTPPPTNTPTLTATSLPTNTPAPTSTNTPLPFVRPQMVVNSTSTKGAVQTNGEFKLNVSLENAGTATAYSAQAVFSSSDLVPLKTGGVVALGAVSAGNNVGAVQNFLVTGYIYGKSIVVVDLTVTYYDDQGTSYSDKFTLSITPSGGVAGGVAAATATPTGVKSSQLVITGYSTDIDLLQPGEQFSLKLDVQNVGNAKAQRITMIVGGGSSGTSGGTPQPGGVSGGGGEFTNFAPVGASNVQSLGDLSAGDKVQANQNLIVNVSTNPGAYPMKITFSYLNDKGEVINDEQVITLLVYSLPNVDISFYRPPDPFFTGQPGALPIQVVNLGRRVAVLGNLKIETASGFIENGTSLVGSLDTGGYFTLDSIFTPEQVGTMTLEVTIEYVDDFNQPRTITKTLEVEVTEMILEENPFPPEGGGAFPPESTEETLWQKFKRFVLGILGLDSSRASDGESIESAPIEEPLPVPAGGKGG